MRRVGIGVGALPPRRDGSATMDYAGPRRSTTTPRSRRTYNSGVLFPPSAVRTLVSALGPLELRVLDALWARENPASIRQLVDTFPGVAYTTLMTTADRLFRKGLLDRQRDGRAFLYTPRWTREDLELRLAASAMTTLLAEDTQTLRPLISLFVDEVSRRDGDMLDELERLIKAKKEAAR